MKRRLLALLVLAALVLGTTGCAQQRSDGSSGSGQTTPPAEKPAAAEEPKQPDYSSWVVYINDDDSFSQGSVTYKIALNFTATNPTQDPAGTYTGNATASTSTNGTVKGLPLNAQAIAQSGTLQFKLDDPAGPDLAQIDPATWKLSGTGTITMKASGSGTIGAAGGSFGNTSSQPIKIDVNGTKATLTVVIQGHKYTFNGTFSGK